MSSSTWVALAISQKSDYVRCHLRSPRGVTTPAGDAMSSVCRGGKIICNARHGQRVLMKINGCVSSSNKQEGQVPPFKGKCGQWKSSQLYCVLKHPHTNSAVYGKGGRKWFRDCTRYIQSNYPAVILSHLLVKVTTQA